MLRNLVNEHLNSPVYKITETLQIKKKDHIVLENWEENFKYWKIINLIWGMNIKENNLELRVTGKIRTISI